MKDNSIIASLDIGSSKIVCLIGYFNMYNKLCVKGIGHQESKGISDGNVEDIQLLTKSIIKVISMAEKMAGINVEEITLSISGSNLKSVFTNVEKDLKDKTINKIDIYDLAKKIEKEFKNDKKEIIHLVPIGYYIDSIKVQSPFGIIGNKIKIDFNAVYTDKLKINNIKSCLKKTPIRITKFVSSSYASATACLTQQEKSNGCLLIDIGAGLTSFAVIQKDLLIYNCSIPLAGNTITSDISDILKTRFEVAEKLKIMNVDLLLDKNEENEIIKINIDNDEDYRIAKNTKKILNDIYKDRVKEIISIIFDILDKKKIRSKVKNIVLTGGTSMVSGIDYYINKITNLEARVGVAEFDFIKNNVEPRKFKNITYSCAVGLLIKTQEKISDRKVNDYNGINRSSISKFFDYLVKLFIC